MLIKGRFSVPFVKVNVAEDWRMRGFTCDEFCDPPGREWNNFIHSCNELITVLVGRLEVKIGAETILAEVGDEVFIAKNTKHSVKNINSGITNWLYGYDAS